MVSKFFTATAVAQLLVALGFHVLPQELAARLRVDWSDS